LKPLEPLLNNYKKKSKKVINWTVEANISYDLVIDQIKKCPILYFVDESSPIYLHTDACDFGVGGYLFQIINGEEKPIAFLSKSLAGAQLNWSTYDKEAFALFYSVFKFQHLLRDAKFIIRTDHKNLLYIGKGGDTAVWLKLMKK
jgi:hypothetical protein